MGLSEWFRGTIQFDTVVNFIIITSNIITQGIQLWLSADYRLCISVHIQLYMDVSKAQNKAYSLFHRLFICHIIIFYIFFYYF